VLAPSKFMPLASENIKNQKAAFAVFFLRKPDRAPPPPPPPRAPAALMTPPLLETVPHFAPSSLPTHPSFQLPN
jgi:hypothetical protein